MNCKNCGAPMTLVPGHNYFFCEYCMSYDFPEETSDGVRVLGEGSEVKCPVCHATLSPASVAETHVLHCEKCRGILAEQQAFPTIVKVLRARASGPPDSPRLLNREEMERRIHCPHCGQPMDTHPYYGPGNVVIDTCIHCALVWLDYGELGTIVDAPGRDRASYGR
jgi:Zn-finger nucleic acid-binding protein